MKNHWRILGSIWSLPATILVWVFYISWAWASGIIIWKGWHSFLIAQFQLANVDSWYARRWRDWYGWSGPNVFIYKDKPGEWDDKWVETTKKHETVHCIQQFRLGVLFYPSYIISSLVLWVFCRNRHAYLDNWFEIEARMVADQKVLFTKDEWPHGPRDRWPWW